MYEIDKKKMKRDINWCLKNVIAISFQCNEIG